MNQRSYRAKALLGVFVLQSLYGYAVFYRLGPNKDTPGQGGDMSGGVNALFMGLALAGVIYTILLQRHDLELQREELRLSREQLHASAESIKPRLGGFRHQYLPRQELRSWDMVSARPLRHRVATGPE